MGIHYLKTVAKFEGHIGPDDAETLASWLREKPRRQVDLAHCENVHAAVLQTLLALKPGIKSKPADRWLCQALEQSATPSPRSGS
ncbi:hypothetical protein AACH06_23940 [Ideonella sp. DXS29W]|uniref:Uncharacterized protein n=1 Tax=Ideonella lacteola TaxID=2984193 RepID=A0ABU9BWU8_9BURK